MGRGTLAERVAIVTGACGGIGGATARLFAEEGAKVVLSDRYPDKLEEMAADLRGKGLTVLPLPCNIMKEEEIGAVVDATIAEFGQIDILANIAQGGLEDHRYLMETTSEVAVRDFFGGPVQSMLFMQKCFPHMKARNYGRIINTSSHAAIVGQPGFTPYAMAKAAILALSRDAAHEWGKHGIVTNSFMPHIRTPAFDLTEQGREAARISEELSPVGYFGKPYEDCAPVLLFLASEAARYVNGQVIGIDGGRTLIA